MDVESYAKARENGDFAAYEAILNDSRSGTAEQRELAARKVAAAYIAEQALQHQPKSQEEQNAIMKGAREKMSEYVNMDDEDADNDIAVYEKHAKITLGDEIRKPVEVPSWSKPVQRISDDDAAVRDFKLRMEGTKGSKEWNDSHDAAGVKRAADGRIISEKTLRADADRSKPKKTEYDDTRGFTVDHERGVMSESEHTELDRFETDRDNDAVAAVEANPPTYVEPGPVTLPNSIE
jgi:hypothetical protein